MTNKNGDDLLNKHQELMQNQKKTLNKDHIYEPSKDKYLKRIAMTKKFSQTIEIANQEKSSFRPT